MQIKSSTKSTRYSQCPKKPKYYLEITISIEFRQKSMNQLRKKKIDKTIQNLRYYKY